MIPVTLAVETAIKMLKIVRNSSISDTTHSRGMKHYVIKSINLLILFERRKNCGMGILMYLFTRRVIKLNAVMLEASLHKKC
jgi:hypothetical protein